MAKQMVNPIERHVEKLVVGVAALILVGAVALYLVSSPNKVEMGGETVTPKTVDSAVAERATEIMLLIRTVEPNVVAPEPMADDFAASLAPLEPAKLALGAPVGPPVPLLDPPITVGGKVKLVKVVRPEKTGVSSGRSTIKTRDSSGNEKLRPANWATVSALFDYKQQVEQQKRTYGAKWDQVVVVSPEIQRRTQRPDGSWSDEDWVDITAHPGWPLPPEPKIEFDERRDGALSPTSSSMTEYTNFLRPLDDLKSQLELLRPLMYVTVNGDEWKFPVLTSYADVVKQDQDYLNPDGSSSVTDRYGLAAAPAAPGPAVVAKDPVDAELDSIREMLDQAKKNQTHELAIAAFNKALDLSNSATASVTQKQRALKLKEEADLLEKDITRRVRLGGGPAPGAPRPGPETAVRQRQPIQQVWAHDAAEDSLQDGFTYQYRIRSRILNSLAADPAKFDNPEDAAKVILVSDWSEPTEPITFEPSSLFFATYEDRSKKLVGIEFFRWYYGVWLKSRRANLGVGERLVTAQRTDVPPLEGSEGKESAEVEWSSNGKTGDVIVDIDLEREMLERKTTRGSDGVSFGPPKKDTSLVYMDAEGRLHEKFVTLDKDHPLKREASGRVWTPKP